MGSNQLVSAWGLPTPKLGRNSTVLKASKVVDRAKVESYHENGYLVVEDYATAEEVNSLRARAQELMDGFDKKELIVFNSNDHGFVNDYFKKSAGGISCFFEDGAFDEDGNMIRDINLSVNKIGHALHDLDPVFQSYSRSLKAKELLEALGVDSPTPVQSMYICKQPQIGGKVVPHQDATFLLTDPPTAVGLWLALEDATVDNGCLFILPKSHKHGIDRRFVRTQDGQTDFDAPAKDYLLSDFEAVEVKTGTLVVLHHAVVHASNANQSSRSRHAYSVHYIDGTSHWDEANWLQRPADFPFKPLIDAHEYEHSL